MVEFTRSELEQYAYKARRHHSDITQQCWEVCHTIGNLLIDNGLPKQTDVYDVPEVRVGPNDDENHHLLVLSGQFVADAPDDADVWVDASFDQFNDQNKADDIVDVSFGTKDELDPVRIMGPTDSRRQQYTSVKTFIEDSFSDLP